MRRPSTQSMRDAVLVAAVGDIGLHGRVGEDIGEHGADYAFSGVAAELERADIRFGNLEIPFAERGATPISRETPPSMRADPASARALEEARFDIVSLANNHIMDFGTQGLMLTIGLLDEIGTGHVGAGETLEEARHPIVLHRRGRRVGFLAYAKEDGHAAGPRSAGSSPIRQSMISEDLAALRPDTDFIVVSLHFGAIYSDYPSREDQALARRIIDLGAHLVIGHHPHVLQGIEAYRRGAIAYSLGEFLFDPTKGNVLACCAGEIRRQSIIADVSLDERGASVDPVPVMIGRDCRPRTCSGEERGAILERVRGISGVLPNYDLDYNKHIASRTADHEIRVLRHYLSRGNFGYVLGRMLRIRANHFKILLEYIARVLAGRRVKS